MHDIVRSSCKQTCNSACEKILKYIVTDGATLPYKREVGPARKCQAFACRPMAKNHSSRAEDANVSSMHVTNCLVVLACLWESSTGTGAIKKSKRFYKKTCSSHYKNA